MLFTKYTSPTSGREIEIFGQQKLHARLEKIAERAKELMEKRNNVNILLNGRTGLGKTTFAEFFLIILQYFQKERYTIWIPSDDDQSIEIWLKDHPEIKYIFVDEAHLIKNPEWLFPFLDKHERLFILATNDAGRLNSALLNGRLFIQTFEEYKTDDLYFMAKTALDEKYKEMNYAYFLHILKCGKRNPRKIVHDICQQLNLFGYDFQTEKDWYDIMDSLGYDKNGFDPQERLYLKILKQSGGTAGLGTLIAGTGITRATIENMIEPDLIANGVISKGMSGRTLNMEV